LKITRAAKGWHYRDFFPLKIIVKNSYKITPGISLKKKVNRTFSLRPRGYFKLRIVFKINL